MQVRGSRHAYALTDMPRCGAYHRIHPEYTAAQLAKFSTETKIAPKVLILGEPAVGKTCLAAQIHRGAFNGTYLPSVGVHYVPLSCMINSIWFSLQVWDVPGHEDCHTLSKLYYRGTEIAFMCFDLTRPETLGSLKDWLKAMTDATGVVDALILVGCKADLPQVVSEDDISAFSHENNMEYFRTSAKEGYNTAELISRTFFLACASTVQPMVRIQVRNDTRTSSKPLSVNLTEDAESPHKTKRCC